MADSTRRTFLSSRTRTLLKRSLAELRRTLVPTTGEQFVWQLAERVHRNDSGVGPKTATTIDMAGRYTDEHAPPPTHTGECPPGMFQSASGVVNPVLTAADVTDYGNAHCVADPFLFVTETGDWHLFFEIYNHHRDPTGVIGHATSDDGYDWHYDRVVLATDEHLSFPYVFRWNGEHYLIPDRWAKRGPPAGVTLYRAEAFPHEWTAVADLVRTDVPLSDFAPFRWDGRWWALLGNGADLHAYYSDTLEAPEWTPHRENPLVTDRLRAGRPAGRPLVFDDRVLAFYQDSVSRYGEKTRAFEITALTPTTFEDTERADSPILEGTGGLGWNSGAMHHIDPWYDGTGWHCAVDGNIGLGYRPFEHHWAIGIYRA